MNERELKCLTKVPARTEGVPRWPKALGKAEQSSVAKRRRDRGRGRRGGGVGEWSRRRRRTREGTVSWEKPAQPSGQLGTGGSCLPLISGAPDRGT